jgi:hypothetical protein
VGVIVGVVGKIAEKPNENKGGWCPRREGIFGSHKTLKHYDYVLSSAIQVGKSGG